MGIVATGVLEVCLPPLEKWQAVAHWEDFVTFQFNKHYEWHRAVREFGKRGYLLEEHERSALLDQLMENEPDEIHVLDMESLKKAVASMKGEESSPVIRMLLPCAKELAESKKMPVRLIVYMQ